MVGYDNMVGIGDLFYRRCRRCSCRTMISGAWSAPLLFTAIAIGKRYSVTGPWLPRASLVIITDIAQFRRTSVGAPMFERDVLVSGSARTSRR